MNNCEQCQFVMRECLDCKVERLERENADYKRGFEATKALLKTQESLIEQRTRERDTALTQLKRGGKLLNEDITTRIRIGTVKHDAVALTDDEFRVLQKNVAEIAAHVARRVRPEWPIQVVPVDLPIWLNVGVGSSEFTEGRDLVESMVDAVSIAGPYSDALKENFQPELFAECFLEDPKRTVALYVERRRTAQ